MAQRAAFYIQVGAFDVTGNFSARSTDISVTDGSGETADSATIRVDDAGGSIFLPPIGDPISIGLGWGFPVMIFDGFVEDVDSQGSRSGGMDISIACKSADLTNGKAKEPIRDNVDDATLGDVMKRWGAAAGIPEVFVHSDLAGISRPWWGIEESFPAWGARIARQLGATFKIMGPRAVFVPRSAGISADGRPLVPIVARRPGNLISWNIKPLIGRPQHARFRTRWWDRETTEWKTSDVDSIAETEATAEYVERFPEPDDQDGAARSGAKAQEADRERGGGSVEIVGDPTATAEAPCTIVGTRPGVDGTYRIDSVTHRYSRSGGFTTSLSLKQPNGGAGKDTRPASSSPGIPARAPADAASSTPAPVSPAGYTGRGGIGRA